MPVIYSDMPIPTDLKDKPSVFLVGPTPRSPDVKSWRPQALEFFKRVSFDSFGGYVLVPEWSTWDSQVDYQSQVEWEWRGLHDCDAIAAWVPRKLPDMAAMITNVEFGFWVRDRKFFYGRPPDAEKCSYLDWLFEQTRRNRGNCRRPVETNLTKLLLSATSYALSTKGIHARKMMNSWIQAYDAGF